MTSPRLLLLTAAAVLCAGCGNSIVAKAGAQDTPTTQPPPAPAVVYQRLQRLGDIAEQALNDHLPTKDEIARSGIEVLRTRTVSAITTKLTALNAAELVLDDTTHVSVTGVETERADIAGAVQGLTALRSAVASESSIVPMRREATDLAGFADVGTLIVPKVLMLGAADGVLRDTDTVSVQVTGIATRISSAQARGKPVGAGPAVLSDLRAQVALAASLAQGLIASVPSITADQLAELSADQAGLAKAKAAVATAQSDIGQIDAALQAASA